MWWAAAPAASSATATITGGQAFSTWGAGGFGQDGDGGTTNRLTPEVITSIPGGVSAVAAGGAHDLAVDSTGRVWTWGWNKYGELGLGTTTGPQLCPFPSGTAPCSTTPRQVGGPSGVTAVAGGDLHSLALTSAGTVWAWGYDHDGELGDGSFLSVGCDCVDTPAQVPNLSGVVAIAGGGRYSLALRSDGTVWAWGNNSAGQLGDGSTANSAVPVQVKGLTGVVAIAAGYFHGVAVEQGGKVYAWGKGSSGQLGDGSTASSDVPVPVANLTGVTAVAGGGQYTMGLRSDGTVWTWGDNRYGELGDGSTVASDVPVQVASLQGVTRLAAGHRYALAATSGGQLWAWGQNSAGEFGNGTTVGSTVPVKSSVIAGLEALGAGDHTAITMQVP